MDTVYLVSLIVGGFFVLLSLFGGDADGDLDAGGDAGGGGDVHLDHDIGSGAGLVDLFSLRTLFLFAAFFGLTGVLLDLIGSGEPFTAIVSVLMGLAVGLGGNYVIQRVGYAHVSSDIATQDLSGRTAKVLLPFEGRERGKISVVAKGHRLQLTAQALDGSNEAFRPGDEVVVLRMNGRVAEVVKPE